MTEHKVVLITGASLAPGQKAEVSVAGAVGTAPAVLELAYDGVYLAVWSVAAHPDG
jgi:hypothetical protein